VISRSRPRAKLVAESPTVPSSSRPETSLRAIIPPSYAYAMVMQDINRGLFQRLRGGDNRSAGQAEASGSWMTEFGLHPVD